MPFLLATLVGLLAMIVLPSMVVGKLITRRGGKFNTRFPDAIDLLVRGLRAGLPVTEPFQVVSQELPGPVGEELKAVVERIRLGNRLEAALQESAETRGTPGFPVVCILIAIPRQPGGQLGEAQGSLTTGPSGDAKGKPQHANN